MGTDLELTLKEMAKGAFAPVILSCARPYSTQA